MPWVRNLKTGLVHEVPAWHFSLKTPAEYEEVVQPVSPSAPGESAVTPASASVKEVESSQPPITASSPPPSRGPKSGRARRTTP